MSPLLLALRRAWACAVDADFSEQPKHCRGCDRMVRITRRSLIGTDGCTACTPRKREQVRSDHF